MEKEDKVMISVKVKRDIKRRFKIFCDSRGMKLNDRIGQLMAQDAEKIEIIEN